MWPRPLRLGALCDHKSMAKGLNEEAAGISTTHDFGAAAKITRRAADRLRAGHLWVYRSDVEKLLPASGATSEAREIPPGALVTVLDGRGAPLGTALFSSASQICLRMVSEEAGLTRAAYLDAVRERVTAALRLRDALAPSSGENNGCRLLFSEADGLPGIVADRYNGLVVLQLLTQGTAQADVRAALREVLSAQPWVSTIVERPDPRIRELEELAAAPVEPLFVRDGNAASRPSY
jgi:23S rRNA (cytosine1962-C5)-methyltransferase